MKPSEGLRRTGFANRGGPLAKVSAKRLAALGGFARSTFSPKSSPKPAVPADVAAVVKARAGGRCEIGIFIIVGLCRGKGTQLHHRITQKMGGRKRSAKERSDRPSNLLFVCDFCHAIVTNHVWVDPYVVGWSLRERQEPTAEPVLYRGDLVYLDDAGEIHSFQEVGA